VALNEAFVLHQGRFTGRPSRIEVEPCGAALRGAALRGAALRGAALRGAEPRGRAGDVGRVLVGGQVALVARGTLRSTP
jgi:uncharacterized protein YjbI with pentapeptide repeats